MTVRKGVDWGVPGALDPDAPVVATDADIARLLSARRAAGETGPVEVGVLAGDLHRTLGSPQHTEGDLRAGRGVRYPCDAIAVHLDGPEDPAEAVAVAHVVARRGRRLFAARTVVVMNATHRGPADLGPRAHPGDGLLDVTDGAVPRREVRTALRRAVTGSHVPHPGLAERRGPAFSFSSDEGPWSVELDGVPAGRATSFRVECLPDALVVVA